MKIWKVICLSQVVIAARLRRRVNNECQNKRLEIEIEVENDLLKVNLIFQLYLKKFQLYIFQLYLKKLDQKLNIFFSGCRSKMDNWLIRNSNQNHLSDTAHLRPNFLYEGLWINHRRPMYARNSNARWWLMRAKSGVSARRSTPHVPRTPRNCTKWLLKWLPVRMVKQPGTSTRVRASSWRLRLLEHFRISLGRAVQNREAP